jgi:hypothetical protein
VAIGREQRFEERRPRVIDDVLVCSGGTLRGLVGAAHLAVEDRRDLSVLASELRPRSD